MLVPSSSSSSARTPCRSARGPRRLLRAALPRCLVLAALLTASAAMAQATESAAPPASAAPQSLAQQASAVVTGNPFLAAAVATGLAAIGAGIAVGIAGAAAIGAIAERPELLGRSLIFVGLAEGIVIYGLIVSFIILGAR